MKKELSLLKQIDKELYLIKGTGAILQWDRATLMPKKGIEVRGDQASLLSKLMHEKITSKELKRVIRVLSKKVNYNKLSSLDKKVVDKYKKHIKKLSRIPSSHVEAFSKLTIESSAAWEKAKEKKDFKIFQPYLEKIIAMKKREAKLIDKREDPYNVFLDDFEEGMKVKDVEKVFEKLKIGLIELLDTIKKSKKHKSQKDTLSKLDFPADAQEIIVRGR